MNTTVPQVTRTYQNHHLDSTRWRHYEPVAGDVVVTTAYKAGTTWTQLIVMSLLDPDRSEMPNIHQDSPWPDRRFGQSDDEVAERLRNRDRNRPQCLKSHLPLDGLPYHGETRYLVVGRDPRDVFMSLFNHYSNYNDGTYERMNSGARVGDPLPPCPEDPRTLWKAWISRGWFDWEQEGWPFWANMGHTRSYWAHRHLPNLLFVHYRDLSEDLDGQIARIARFAGIDADDALIEWVAQRSHFQTVKRNAAALMPHLDEAFQGGADAFFHKGGAGRWRDVLTAEDLTLYEEAKARLLPPQCAHWLEHGGEVAS